MDYGLLLLVQLLLFIVLVKIQVVLHLSRIHQASYAGTAPQECSL